MFDLPTKTKAEKRAYTQFREFLISDGYSMMQYSVYCRVTNGLDGVEKHLRRVKCAIPSTGNIRVLTVTESQFATMQFLVGEPTIQEKSVGAQLELVF